VDSERLSAGRIARRFSFRPGHRLDDIEWIAARRHRGVVRRIILSKTLDGIITSWNPAAERIFGWTAAEAVGRHITLIIPEDRRAEEDDVLARIRRGERVDHFETVRRTKDGRLVDVSITVSPVKDAAGHIVGASKVARDITERRKNEVALRRQSRAPASDFGVLSSTSFAK
jgi:PAS domain S-box-containing protein